VATPVSVAEFIVEPLAVIHERFAEPQPLATRVNVEPKQTFVLPVTLSVDCVTPIDMEPVDKQP
jgi:hypothetical protein